MQTKRINAIKTMSFQGSQTCMMTCDFRGQINNKCACFLSLITQTTSHCCEIGQHTKPECAPSDDPMCPLNPEIWNNFSTRETFVVSNGCKTCFSRKTVLPCSRNAKKHSMRITRNACWLTCIIKVRALLRNLNVTRSNNLLSVALLLTASIFGYQ